MSFSGADSLTWARSADKHLHPGSAMLTCRRLRDPGLHPGERQLPFGRSKDNRFWALSRRHEVVRSSDTACA
jgi:hypothetical protein